MAANIVGRNLILLCSFSFLVCVVCLEEDDDDDNKYHPISVTSILNLNEGTRFTTISPERLEDLHHFKKLAVKYEYLIGEVCTTDGHNGTCMSLNSCWSAYVTSIFLNVDYDPGTVPKFPEICSNNEGKSPIVCCTDCRFSETVTDTDDHIAMPTGEHKKKSGPKIRDRCLDYFQNLPYPCHDVRTVKYTKTWVEERQCSSYGHARWLATGGHEAERWEFRHMALLGYGEDKQSAQWLCGGSVISEKFILTAAHCTSSPLLGPVTLAALGLLKRSDPPEYWKVHQIKRIILHPDYKSPSKYHDIALLETENEINFGKNLLPACLDYGSSEKIKAEASGWGRLGNRQSLANVLQVVKIYEYDELECALAFPPHRHLNQGYNHTTQMCFGSHDEVIDTCEGDSGGPLQTNEEKCLYTIIGVTSYGKACGILSAPGMYTRVSYYVPWIESIVWPPT